jgi:hypothetical protein
MRFACPPDKAQDPLPTKLARGRNLPGKFRWHRRSLSGRGAAHSRHTIAMTLEPPQEGVAPAARTPPDLATPGRPPQLRGEGYVRYILLGRGA